MLGQYAKGIAAGVGLIAILFKDILGIEIGTVTVDNVVNGILALGTWYSVIMLHNNPA